MSVCCQFTFIVEIGIEISKILEINNHFTLSCLTKLSIAYSFLKPHTFS